MPTTERQWPAWAEYTYKNATQVEDPEFFAIKKSIIDEFGRDALFASWVKVCKELQSVTEGIVRKGNEIIPVFDAAQIVEIGFTDAEREEVKRVGTFVCRSTVPEAEAALQYGKLKQYLADNDGSIKAWPPESPSMLILYNSPTQTALRSHPNQRKLQRRLNELWHDSTDDAFADPLVYVDGLRDRAPGVPFLGLGPHVDAGSLCRWADPTYRKVYASIFSGKPEQHDPYDLSLRKNANQTMYEGTAHSHVLRTFQGWTALTPTAPREGTIMLYPNVKTTIAYILLRPFFQPPSDPEADIMDSEKWTLDESTGWFPGTFKPQSQRLSRESHPHLRLEDCLVYAPEIKAGDTVWWHSDLCHAVDTEHLGKQNAAVAFIASCPSTPANKRYIKEQLAAMLEGRPGADYAERNEIDETRLKGYVGLDGMDEEARKAFGFHLLEGQS